MPRDESSTPDPAAHDRAAAWLKTLPPPDVMAVLRAESIVINDPSPPFRAALCPCPAHDRAAAWLAEGDDGWEVGEPDARLRDRLIAVAAELRDDPDLDAIAVTLCAMADEVGAVEAERDDLRNCPPRWLESHP